MNLTNDGIEPDTATNAQVALAIENVRMKAASALRSAESLRKMAHDNLDRAKQLEDENKGLA